MKIQSQLLTKVRAVHKRTHIDQRTIWKRIEAAGITREKVDEICRLIPGFKNEINWERGQSKASNKDVEYKFKNGSILDVMAGRESSRGKRYTFGLMEECILIDETALNEIIIPSFWGVAA